MTRELNVVGKRLPFKDSNEIVTGRAIYAGDFKLPRTLCMKVLRSPFPHAIIKGINTSKAEALPGVEAVLTYKDLPPFELHEANWTGPILPEKVRYVGDEVAVVAAVDEETAKNALELIEVHYEPIPAVFDVEEAMRPDAPLVVDEKYKDAGGNVRPDVAAARRVRGNPEEGFKEADVIVEQEMKLQSIHTMPLANTITAWWEGNLVNVECSHQEPQNHVRICVAAAHGISENKVNVITPKGTYSGGIFNHTSRLFVLPTFLAKKAGKPVRYDFTMEELFFYKFRDSGVHRLKMGLKRDGTITALTYEQIFNNGAYGFKYEPAEEWSSTYRIPNNEFRPSGTSTNLVSTGCIRGVGSYTQTAAGEQLIDKAAEVLGMDPIEFRKKNHARAPRETTSEVYDEMMEMGSERIGWKNKWKGWGKPYDIRASKRRAVGMSITNHGSGCPVPDLVVVIINDDGTAQVLMGHGEIGTQVLTTQAQIVAEALGFRFEDVEIPPVQTIYTGHQRGLSDSRTAHIVGTSSMHAAFDAKKKLLEWSAKLLKVKPEELDIKDTRIYVKDNPEVGMHVKEAMEYPVRHESPPIAGSAALTPYGWEDTFAKQCLACFADVEVDTETGEVKVLEMIVLHDVGQPINPAVCETQIGGGTQLSIGYALSEEVVFNKDDGRVLNCNNIDYKWPTALDLPPLKTVLADCIDSTGPFGVKGAGEGSAIPQHAAIASAIYNAIGVRFNERPITPDKVLKALGKA